MVNVVNSGLIPGIARTLTYQVHPESGTKWGCDVRSHVVSDCVEEVDLMSRT
jgi:hypothetical protein